MKNSIIISLVLLGCLFVNTIAAQSGNIVVHVGWQIEEGKLEILKGKEVIESIPLNIDSVSFHFDELDEGAYSVKLTVTKPLNYTTQMDVLVENKMVKEIEFVSPRVDTMEEAVFFEDSLDTEFTIFGFNTGNNFINSEKEFASQTQLSLKGILTTPITKFFHFGGGYGFSYNRAIINRAFAITDIEEYDKEYYASLTFDPELFFRLSAFNKAKNKLFLDFGASYNFPVFSRHYVVDGRTKIRTKNIHKYNDVQAIARIGYSVFALTLDYSLTDFMKNEHYELPKYKIGVAIILPN